VFCISLVIMTLAEAASVACVPEGGRIYLSMATVPAKPTPLGKNYVAFKDPDGISWEFYRA